MDEPNVLFLDEPTNDLDIETLTQLEDLLDGWPGSMVVISHDRFFIERTTDNVFALLGDAHPADAAARHRRVPGAAPADGGGRRGRRAAPPPPPPRQGRRPPTPARRRRNSRRSSASWTRSPSRRPSCTPRSPTTPPTSRRSPSSTRELRALAGEREELEMRWLELAEDA